MFFEMAVDQSTLPIRYWKSPCVLKLLSSKLDRGRLNESFISLKSCLFSKDDLSSNKIAIPTILLSLFVS